ncbi:MAG: DUF350 domain-containing protein [Desulfobacterales bacterium]|nr:DUF350 domain-containing protein [Desulfobacterales bacterium]
MDWNILFLNIIYAIFGVSLAIFSMYIGYKLFDHIMPFRTHKELANRNVAVAIVVSSIFLGLGIAVGLVVGLGLN